MSAKPWSLSALGSAPGGTGVLAVLGVRGVLLDVAVLCVVWVCAGAAVDDCVDCVRRR